MLESLSKMISVALFVSVNFKLKKELYVAKRNYKERYLLTIGDCIYI